ncbi:MAG: 2-C-methyl-D-erythritol 4-phosphate cytidylyltransferase [Proteobacteria bacterium]|nr:2-C-methyl-D-erythritol 4-phosphate cytidylyltransferase [Pseudomonadota bacterium]MDA1291441.1 2-C-methyl-D-erythritol 4-phosphate cytidylyltransferase [Pseudomonadota bacterium]
MTIWAILPAAGIGRRMGSTIPKQYLTIDGVPLILHSLRRLSAVSEIQKIIVVIHPEDNRWAKLQESIVEEFENRIITVMGGDERYQSVLNGLTAVTELAASDDWVLVHDAVRPCIRTSDIENLISKVSLHPVGGLLGSAVDNTLKKVGADLSVIETVDRESYWNALTPQMFRFAALKESIEAVVASGEQVTDEAAAMEVAGFKPIMIAGHKDNIKITVESDLVLASQILKNQASDNESK